MLKIKTNIRDKINFIQKHMSKLIIFFLIDGFVGILEWCRSSFENAS